MKNEGTKSNKESNKALIVAFSIYFHFANDLKRVEKTSISGAEN
jgi:hypothetical protein